MWERCNSMMISWILNSVSKDIRETIISTRTVKKMWDDLQNQFNQENGPRIFQLHKELSSLTQNQTIVSIYYRKFKCLWDKLLNFNQIFVYNCGTHKKCSCGATQLFLEYQ